MTDRAPERWKYVPEEPNEAMIGAIDKHVGERLLGEGDRGWSIADASYLYAALLAAVPPPPALSGEVDVVTVFSVAFLDGALEDEQPEILRHWAVVKAARDKAASLIERKERENAELRKALAPFVAEADKHDAIYRKRGGNPDSFPNTHPSFDIGCRIFPLGIWRAARRALGGTT